jgi:hypothetical protein
MSVVRIAVPKSPKRIRVRDGDALLEHAKVLQFRSRCHDLIDHELRSAEQRVEEARLKLREAEVAGEQVKLALEAISLEERKAMERFFALVRKSTPQMRVMAERYGGDVSFNFDSNGRSVWVVALFGKDAPPALRTVSDSEVPWASLDDDQEEGGNEEEV